MRPMHRSVRITSGLALALIVITCTDRAVTGPRYRGQIGLNLAAFNSPTSTSGGQPPIPIDSVSASLTSLDGPDDYDTTFAFGGIPYTGDQVPVALLVPLKQSKETFAFHLSVKGQGSTWFVASDTITVVAGLNAPPPITAIFVGPGHNAGLMFIGPQDSTVIPGLPVALRASVSDSFEATLTGVPVGFRLQNPALGAITYPTYLTPILIPINTGTKVDTTWLIAETPNHIFDSTLIYIVPKTGGGAATQIFLVSGDAQVDTPKATLPLPLTTLVTDTNGIPVAAAKVAWVKTGLGSFVSPDTTVADSFGFAKMTYKLGTGLGTDTVTASLVGPVGVPHPSVTFTATADTGNSLSFDTTSYMLGKGQEVFAVQIHTKITAPVDLPVKISVSDSTAPAASQILAVLDTPIIIPKGLNSTCCLEIVGKNLGTATLIAHAAGYRNATASVVVTTPMLLLTPPSFTYNGLASSIAYIETADSTGTPHFNATDVVVGDTSADSTIVKPDSAVFTIPAATAIGTTSFSGITPGTTTVTFKAAGYTPALMPITVDTTLLQVYAGGGYAAGLGQTTSNNEMYLPAPPRGPVKVSLTSSNPAVFTVPDTVTLFPDSFFVTFPITGVGLGQATLTARTPGLFVFDSVQLLTVSTPTVQPVVAGSVARGVKTQVYVYTEDSLGFRSGFVTAPLTVTLSTTDPNAVWDSTHMTIKAGTDLDSVGVIFNSTGLFTVRASAPGYATDSTFTNAAAPPIGSATRSVAAPARVRVAPMYPDSLRRRAAAKRPAPPRR